MITVRKQDLVNINDVLHLYQAVGWTNYTHQPQMLEQALSHSLAIYLALDGDAVVGLIVLPSHQRQRIGGVLMKEALTDYKDAYQVQLVTDQTEKNLGFYRSLGFETLSTYDCTGMIWVDRKK